MKPTPTPTQLDIFADSRDVVLRNDVLAALERRDAQAAASGWQALGSDFPHDDRLPALACLLAALQAAESAPFNDHTALRDARRALADSVEPAARTLFGESAGACWTAPLWQDLARRAAALPYQSAHADEHSAPLWLQAREWAHARDAVSCIASWHHIPAPLAWMAQARFYLDGMDAAWPLIAALAWLSPTRFDALTRPLPDAPLSKLRRRFDAHFDGSGDVADLAWFPAWALTEEPRLAGVLRPTRPGQHSAAERAMRLLLELLGLERQGAQHELVAQRKRLRDLHPALFAAYMASR